HLDAPAIPEQPYEQTLNWLDEQISSRSSRMNGLSDADRVVLSSQQQYRRIARRLLIVGHEAGADGAIATMSAQMLINSAKTFDQLVEPLPDRVRVMLSQREIDPHEMQGLSQAVRALRQFNAFNDVQIDALKEANAESVDAYLKQMLAPLATLAVHLDHGSPQTTWVSLSTGTTNGYRQAKILPSHIAALQHRIDQTRMNTALWEHHAQILAMMQRATDSPHLQPHLQMFHRELNRLLDIEQTLNDADWLTPSARGDLKRRSATAAVLLKDPATRAEAHRIIDHLSRMLETLRAIDGVATHNIDVAPMRNVLLIAYRLSEQPQTAPTAEALLDYLERLCVTIDQQQQMRPDDLPLDIRKVFSVIQRQYAAEQKHLRVTLPALTAAPHMVTQPRWSEPLARLERLHQQAVRLHSVPHWLDRMNRLNPHASRGLYQQLRLIAADLLNEPNNAGAAEALDQLELQLTLFEALPYESQITPSHASVSKLTGGTL
ncbi:MAG: hypothetical protein MI802_05750, partial [Desulfobacterales bacterium]|nr:hypothetical protein [Desulfobacterales bacterium]